MMLCVTIFIVYVQAMMEVFEVICNKDVADTSMADIFSTFCAGILSKASDEPTEVILGKVLPLQQIIYTN